MRKFTAYLATFLFAYLFWILFLMQDFNVLNLGIQEISTGVIVAALVSYFTTKFFIQKDGLFIFKRFRIVKLIVYIPMYFIELIKANIKVAILALSPKSKIESGIIKIKTKLKSDLGLAMLANSITLTPGTITVDIFEENDEVVMYIHWLNPKSEDIEEASEIIKGKFERKIGGIFE